jgi:membrane protease YdiL (CAAX protease family)
MYIMKKRSGTRLGIFLSIVLSSCVFGLVHLVNIFTSSPGAVIRQIGYSALIGAMCSIVLIATRNIWLCVICHGVYNFCGGIIDKFGNGNMWTVPQIICTATVAVIVAAYMVWIFFKLPIDNAKELYREQKKAEQ